MREFARCDTRPHDRRKHVLERREIAHDTRRDDAGKHGHQPTIHQRCNDPPVRRIPAYKQNFAPSCDHCGKARQPLRCQCRSTTAHRAQAERAKRQTAECRRLWNCRRSDPDSGGGLVGPINNLSAGNGVHAQAEPTIVRGRRVRTRIESICAIRVELKPDNSRCVIRNIDVLNSTRGGEESRSKGHRPNGGEIDRGQ